MDAANLLKPMLARGELHCIGATTLDSTASNIERTPRSSGASSRWSWTSRASRTPCRSCAASKERFELHHGVRIQDNALVSAVTLSDRLHHRPLPARQAST